MYCMYVCSLEALSRSQHTHRRVDQTTHSNLLIDAWRQLIAKAYRTINDHTEDSGFAKSQRTIIKIGYSHIYH